jgi:hypothetical protein
MGCSKSTVVLTSASRTSGVMSWGGVIVGS